GIVGHDRYAKVQYKQEVIDQECARLHKTWKQFGSKGFTIAQLLCRPENNYKSLLNEYPDAVQDHGEEINFQIELNLKFAGYIQRQQTEVEKLSHSENIKIPKEFDFSRILGLRLEARQKLAQANPENLGQASRIPGVSPADISVLMISLIK